jgi:adenosylcobinamide-GDP ribazoletransferase
MIEVRLPRVALGFLTRLPSGPTPRWQADDLAASAPWFPLIGALVGGGGAAAYALAAGIGLPPWPAAGLAVAAAVLVTGGLHEDGLADVADGFGGGRTPAAKLGIMRDSRLGSFGALALMLALLLRISALAALAAPLAVAAALIAAGAMSRGLLPAVMAVAPLARADGLAAGAGRPHPARAAASLLVALLLGLLTLPPLAALLSIAMAALAALAMACLAWRQIGGITGDVLGASQQLAEIAALLTVLAWLGPAAG